MTYFDRYIGIIWNWGGMKKIGFFIKKSIMQRSIQHLLTT